MSTKLYVAGILLLSSAAMADQAPAICLNVANYAAQALDQEFTDGSWGTMHNPASLALRSDFNKFPVTNAKSLGTCDENPQIPPAYCRVAGGEPEVYEIEVAKREQSSGTSPFAKVTVTFNRGGCFVDSTTRM